MTASTTEIWVVVAAIGVLTFAIRASFLAFAHRFAELSTGVQQALRMIPPAVFAALVVPSILHSGGQLDLWSPRAVAGLLAAGVAYATRSILATLLIGVAALVGLEKLPWWA